MWPSEFPLTNDEACAPAGSVHGYNWPTWWVAPTTSIVDFSTEELVAELVRRRDEAKNISRLVKEAELDYDGE